MPAPLSGAAEAAHPDDTAAGVGSGAGAPRYSKLRPNVAELHDDAVVEFVPRRTLSTGVVVPAYTEAPLRIKPPDHAFLTPDEAALEEDARLQLYSDIATRIEHAMAALEVRVFERRKAQGWPEKRGLLP